jgi:hypothetical protein
VLPHQEMLPRSPKAAFGRNQRGTRRNADFADYAD